MGEHPTTSCRKTRGAKTTRAQYEIYIAELENNANFRENRSSPEITIAQSWENLTKNLNSCGGPKKDAKAWKKTFADWKSQIRKKSREIRNATLETGNQGEPEKPLSDLEQKLLLYTGEIAVDGLTGVPEVGVDNENAINTAMTAHIEVQTEAETKKLQIKPAKNKIRATQPSTLAGAVKELSNVRETEADLMRNINTNLEKLVALKEEKLLLTKMKLQIKYNVTFEDSASRASSDKE